MADTQRFTIRHSIEDVIRILENEPVKGDIVPQITAVQVMNRMSIAHLSIERALKFMITKAGGPLIEKHDLRSQYQELLRDDPASARFLGEAFEAAVRHYRYNPNAANMTHLSTLDRYLEIVGSDRAFQDIRYWELTQSLNEVLLGRIYLTLHIELLHGVSQLLLRPDSPRLTVTGRVELAVREAMFYRADLAYGQGTPKEQSVRSYLEWLQGFSTYSEALACAVRDGFDIGDELMERIVRKAYGTLLEATDPAVKYFAGTLDVLPRQPREVIPCVEWLGPEKERRGCVKTPAGTVLGFIDRGPDGLWYIRPLGEGAVAVSAKAETQTDARCYLAALLSRPARATVEGEDRSLRIVGGKHRFFKRNHSEVNWMGESLVDNAPTTYRATLWDRVHEMEVNQRVRMEVRSEDEDGVVVDILEGTVTEIVEQEVHISGFNVLGLEQKSLD